MIRKKISGLDPLTNVANWRGFEEYAGREYSRAKRTRLPITLAYIDLDNFKKVNDTLGHKTGGKLLKCVAEMIQTSIRPSDMAARIGGDEFILLLVEGEREGAHRVLERVRQRLGNEMEERNWPVTFCVGAVTFNEMPASVESLVKKADDLMYRVKNNEKNGLLHEQWPLESVKIKDAGKYN